VGNALKRRVRDRKIWGQYVKNLNAASKEKSNQTLHEYPTNHLSCFSFSLCCPCSMFGGGFGGLGAQPSAEKANTNVFGAMSTFGGSATPNTGGQ